MRNPINQLNSTATLHERPNSSVISCASWHLPRPLTRCVAWGVFPTSVFPTGRFRCFLFFFQGVDPGRWRWNLQITHYHPFRKDNYSSKPPWLCYNMFHAYLQGCKSGEKMGGEPAATGTKPQGLKEPEFQFHSKLEGFWRIGMYKKRWLEDLFFQWHEMNLETKPTKRDHNINHLEPLRPPRLLQHQWW